VRSIRVVALLAVFSITAALHAEKSSPLLTNLNSEFLGKSFQTKLKVGSNATGLTDSSNEQRHLIDTEVDINGDVKYLARGLWPTLRISQDRVTALFAPGTPLWVWKIELKDDRIEFSLSSSETTHTVATYAKLKFMLGKGYESWDYGRIEGVIANSLRIEHLEKLAQLKADYTDLTRQLEAAKLTDSSVSAKDLDGQISSKQHLQVLYEKLVANRLEIASMGQSDTESATFRKEADAIRIDVAQLQEQRKSQRRAELAANATAVRQRYVSLKQRISTTPSNNKLQLQHRQDDIAAAKKILGDLKSNYTQQQALGFLVPPADLSWLDMESKTLDSLLADVPNMEARLNLNALEVQYKAMEQKRNALQAAYMKAAGTPDQTAAADALKKHLRLMYDNRIAAERAGSKSAKQQAAGLQMVMQHLN
jgi:hypothetical protein